MAVIGIDLGTTNSIATVYKDGSAITIPNSFGEIMTPSVVSIDEDGTVLVGKIARNRLISHPLHTVANFKQNMGTEYTYKIAQRTFRSEDLSSFVLRQLKEDAEKFLNESVTEAIISVPAYFDNNQRSATKLAGKLAGLNVERIINEPSAAAIYYKNQTDKDGTYLVFDLGGGTLDVTVVDIFQNVVDILAVSGDNHLGGNNFDDLIAQHFLNQHENLKNKLSAKELSYLLEQAEACKRALSIAPVAVMVYNYDNQKYEVCITQKELLQICAPLFSAIKIAIKSVLRDSGRTIQDITDVILVGGSTKMTLIQEYMKYLTKKDDIHTFNPNSSIALGVGLAAGIKQRKEEIRDTVLLDICPFSLGIAIHHNDKKIFSPIIERNSTLPISREQHYVTVGDMQDKIHLKIYQGESMNPKDNLLLSQMFINVPPLPKGQACVAVRFTYDINGILEVDVKCLNTEKTEHELILKDANLSESQINERLEKLAELKISAEEQNDNKLLIAKAQRMFEENMGTTRGLIEMNLDHFRHIIENSHNITDQMKARSNFESFLNEIDDYGYGLSE